MFKKLVFRFPKNLPLPYTAHASSRDLIGFSPNSRIEMNLYQLNHILCSLLNTNIIFMCKTNLLLNVEKVLSNFKIIGYRGQSHSENDKLSNFCLQN